MSQFLSYSDVNVADNNNQGEINVNHRKYNADDDISEFNTSINSDKLEDRSNTQSVVSESYNIFFIKMNKNKPSDITCGEENRSGNNKSEYNNIYRK